MDETAHPAAAACPALSTQDLPPRKPATGTSRTVLQVSDNGAVSPAVSALLASFVPEESAVTLARNSPEVTVLCNRNRGCTPLPVGAKPPGGYNGDVITLPPGWFLSFEEKPTLSREIDEWI